MECENCCLLHEGQYGSGRFCSSTCARSFSTKNKRKEINQRVSNTLSGRKVSSHVWTDKDREKAKIALRKKKALDRELVLSTRPFEEWPISAKRNFVLHEQDFKCAECGISQEWNGKFLKLQLDHIDGCKKTKHDNRRENLRFLCPNCHSQTATFGHKNRTEEGLARLKIGAAKAGRKSKGRTGISGYKVLTPNKNK